MRNIAEYLDKVCESILNDHLDIVNLANEVREISRNFDYKEIRQAALQKMASAQEKYSKGTKLTGLLGYYYPSQLRLFRTDNMKRGRLVKKAGGSDLIYRYDDGGELFCIEFPNLYSTAYRLEFQGCEVYIAYKDYLHQNSPEILNTVLVKKDCNRQILCIIDAIWSCDMKCIHDFNIDICYDKATKYRIISAMEYPEGNFTIFEDKNYTVVCNASLEILDYNEY